MSLLFFSSKVAPQPALGHDLRCSIAKLRKVSENVQTITRKKQNPSFSLRRRRDSITLLLALVDQNCSKISMRFSVGGWVAKSELKNEAKPEVRPCG